MTQMTQNRRGTKSRTVFIAALGVAAMGCVPGIRSARAASLPLPPPESRAKTVPQAQWLVVGQTIGNPVIGATLMQIIWGGTKDGDPVVLPDPALDPDMKGDAVVSTQTPSPAKNTEISRQGK